MTDPTIYWHDYETWGVNPQKDPACQFAGIRTDLDLNIISEPLNIYCQIPNDYLPHPQACLITGTTPQKSLREGLIEAEFIARIEKEFSQPNTCVAGYNSIRFDDEVTRNTLYRNFYDPYAREWQNGNSRWDIIDMLRACYALRPEGINWCYKDDGSPSFRLEELSVANNIQHLDAHDAMSDVYATIGMAKALKQAQPKLYQYLFSLRDKRKVAELIDYTNMTPLVHVSSKIPAHQGCTTWIVPLAPHPTNKNAVITLNLTLDPAPLAALSAEQLRERLYTPASELAQGEQRLPIKLIHLNKCPVLAPAKTLSEENASRLGIDRQQCLAHLAQIKAMTDIRQKVSEIFASEQGSRSLDPDHALYSGGFFSDADRAKMQRVHEMAPEMLGEKEWQFEDPRLATLLFRYRARNYPQTLTAQEMERWQRHRQFRFTDPASPASLTLPQYVQEVEALMMAHPDDTKKQAVLRALYQYAENL